MGAAPALKLWAEKKVYLLTGGGCMNKEQSVKVHDELEKQGRVWCRGLLSQSETTEFCRFCDAGDKPGLRLELTAELARFIGASSELSRIAATFGVDPNPVRIVAFNKSAEANWAVPWHQDRVIAVASRADISGYTNWLQKGDAWHCEPPIDLLQGMVFARVHFDPCSVKNGAMELALGSHARGFVDAQMARRIAEECPIEVCEAEPGDVLYVKALTLHRSRVSELASPRRALRVDYARRMNLSRYLSWSISEPPRRSESGSEQKMTCKEK